LTREFFDGAIKNSRPRIMERYLSKSVPQDLERKMVFVAGPRQVGKTTLAKSVVGADGGYLCRDVDDDRSAILQREFPVAKTLALDEIHKYRAWRKPAQGPLRRLPRPGVAHPRDR